MAAGALTLQLRRQLPLLLTLLVLLLACLTTVGEASATEARGNASRRVTVAGTVMVDPAVANYVLVRVLDGQTGTVVRTTPLDATHTFSFAGLPPTVSAVQAIVQLPERLMRMDKTHSTLTAPIEHGSERGPELTVVLVPPADNAVLRVNGAARAKEESGVLTVLGVLAVMGSLWWVRHRITFALDMSNIRPPLPRKVMVYR